jgi:hypothetical protein
MEGSIRKRRSCMVIFVLRHPGAKALFAPRTHLGHVRIATGSGVGDPRLRARVTTAIREFDELAARLSRRST